MNSAEIDSVIATVQWNLQLQVVFVVDARISYLRNELSGVRVSLLVRLLVSLHIRHRLDIVTQLGQST